MVIRGRLLDGNGAGIPDGMLEWWHPSLATVQRSTTGEDGVFLFDAIKPPAIDGPDGSVQAPHFAVRVLARGILTHYMTRLTLRMNPTRRPIPILKLVPEGRRQTLLAQPVSANEYRFDVVVQGTTRQYSSTFDGLILRPDYLQALLDVEVALAVAAAVSGLIPRSCVADIRDAASSRIVTRSLSWRR